MSNKIIFWGTGLIARCNAYILKDNIECFVNSDIKECGGEIWGIKILYPDEIVNWQDKLIYVPYNFKCEIVNTIKEKGVPVDCIRVYDHNVGVSERECLKTLKKQYNNEKKYKRIIMVPNHSFEYFKKNDLDENTLLLDTYDFKTLEKHNISYIMINFFIYLNEIDHEICESLSPTLENIAKHYASQYSMSVEAARRAVMIKYMYFKNLLEKNGCEEIICGASVDWPGKVLEYICKQNNIRFVSSHKGVIPGTLNFDTFGEVGKSVPAVYSNEFKRLPISDTDMELARRVISRQYEERINRKRQPRNHVLVAENSGWKNDRPVIFFAGQNDIYSRMIPYTDETKTYFSPIFKSSLDAGVYLAKICEKNNWNFVYKPHPMYAKEEDKEILPSNTIYVEQCDINDLIDISDVVVTILSTTNYDAMMRGKPVVMLGYNWSKGQGCTYEAFEESMIEEVLKEAVDNGFTEEQQQCFVENIARLCKYYLYDDMSDRELRFGKKIDLDKLFELQEMLEEM